MNTAEPVVSKFVRLMQMIRFSHTIFALPFAVLAAVMAVCTPLPDGTQVTVRAIEPLALLVCMVCARSTAMAFNRWVDQTIDAKNPRTAMRHLPAGTLGSGEVAVFAIVCALGFIGGCALFLPNPMPLIGSLPVLFFLWGYSLAKRFTSAAHLWLGIALSLAPVCVWVALRGTAVVRDVGDLLPPTVLALAVALWVTGFDIIYACQDEAFDRQEGLFSVPARLGARGAFRVAASCHALMIVTLIAMPTLAPQLGLGPIFYAAVLAIAALLIYEHRLVRPDDLKRINEAFFQVNSIVSVVLMIAGSIDCWLG